MTISTFKDDLAAILHTINLDKIQNVNGLLNRAGRELLLDVDLQETRRKGELTLFNDVYDYSPPSDLNGDKILDLRPQVNRSLLDNPTLIKGEQFDLRKTNKDFTLAIDSDTGSKILRVSASISGNVKINGFDSLTGNGTWAASTGGSNVTLDKVYMTAGAGSINFDIAATGGAIENSTMTQVDLTDHDEISSLFLYVYLPDSSIITNIILRWGNDTSNYWSKTITAPHFGSFKNGWNLCRFDWNGATETGTVAPSTIDYVRVTVTSTALDTDIRVDELYSRLPSIHEIWYYSKYIFKTTAGVFKEETTLDTDEINLDTDSLNLYLHKCGEIASQQLGGADANYDINYYRTNYLEAVHKYKVSYPSQRIRERNTYYRFKW